MRNVKLALWMAAAVILGMELSQAQLAPEHLTISGKLVGGTSYRVTKPENWNGTVVLDLDGGIPPTRGFTRWMLDHGYAQGGTTRGACGYNFPQCVDNLVEVRRLFGQRFGVPKRTIITGGSRGGFVARLALERYPKLFDGAMTSAGGGAGSIATMNSKLDAVWALKTLVNSKAPLRLVNITNVQEENAALTALLNEAIATPQGRARFTLAAAYEQFPLWSNPRIAEPAATDYEAQLDQIASSFVFANPPTVREGMEKVAGGNIAWNDGIDYGRLLELSGRKDMVAALYRKANLDLDSDLATLDGHSTYITDGKIRASRRKLSTPPWGDVETPWHAQMTADDQPLSATKPAELVFDFTPTSWVFRAGHRVRVTILNSGGKRFQVPADWDRKNPPQITVHRGGVHASSLVLPLIPENSKFFAGSTSQQPR